MSATLFDIQSEIDSAVQCASLSNAFISRVPVLNVFKFVFIETIVV